MGKNKASFISLIFFFFTLQDLLGRIYILSLISVVSIFFINVNAENTFNVLDYGAIGDGNSNDSLVNDIFIFLNLNHLQTPIISQCKKLKMVLRFWIIGIWESLGCNLQCNGRHTNHDYSKGKDISGVSHDLHWPLQIQ